MLKKTITYEDFNGEEVSEDFYFHLSKAELITMELSHQGGLGAALQRIVAAEDGKAIIAEFKGIILGAYGKRSDDGRRFIKSQILRDEFESSEAYSTLFVELVTDTDAAIEFINGVVPKKLVDEAALVANNTASPQIPPLVEPVEPIILSRVQVELMSTEEFTKLGPRIASGEIILGE